MKMTSLERRAVFGLSSILSLRMIGLFMVLPIFTLYATQLPGATPTLVGLALGIYGLAQALFQIPFGALSDRYGRKPIILIGLIIFSFGSLLAAFSHSILLMILGRALQGVGAVGSTLLAMVADFTSEKQRTKAMAIAGITIGFSFSLAMFVGPILMQWMAVNQLFYIAAGLGVIAIVVLYTAVPTPAASAASEVARIKERSDGSADAPSLHPLTRLLTTPSLAKLNLGIFILHAIFTASFIVIPINLYHLAGLAANKQWTLYLPTLLIAFILTLACIGFAERKKQIKPFFLSSIAALGIADVCLWLNPSSLRFTAIGLGLFFTAFSILEAFLPSLVSRLAPPAQKGSALGLYSCAQFSGIFIGGIVGGWFYGKFSFPGVYLFCLFLSLCWLTLALDFIRPQEQLQSE
jgi:MFS family permease